MTVKVSVSLSTSEVSAVEQPAAGHDAAPGEPRDAPLCLSVLRVTRFWQKPPIGVLVPVRYRPPLEQFQVLQAVAERAHARFKPVDTLLNGGARLRILGQR